MSGADAKWTAAQTDQLVALVAAGYSAQMAGDALGVTRGSAIGRAWRAGLHFHSDEDGGKRKARSNQYTARQQLAADRRARHRAQQRDYAKRSAEERRREREDERALKALERERRIRDLGLRKPGRLVAFAFGMFD